MSGYGSTYAQNGNDSYYTITGILKDAKTSQKII